MIAKSRIKYDGKWYNAGDELPGGSTVTAEEIEDMKYFSLKALAAKHGISAKGKNMAELKAEVLEKLGL